MNIEYLKKFEVQNVRGTIYNELWVPAKKLDEFNDNIIGKVEVIGDIRKNKIELFQMLNFIVIIGL